MGPGSPIAAPEASTALALRRAASVPVEEEVAHAEAVIPHEVEEVDGMP
jgi:hypothetical protein